MMALYLSGWQHFADFTTRANRAQYWLFTLVNSAFGWILMGLGHGFVVVAYLWLFVLIIPNIAIQVRRLHDINRSGWWILIVLVPIVGSIVLLVFDLLPGVSPNRYDEPVI
ncbi:MAG: DUF805 domain-containing protein [Firmicutes bacterium]|nr:DUF805 domain-containing protein [Bacillota bacterium]